MINRLSDVRPSTVADLSTRSTLFARKNSFGLIDPLRGVVEERLQDLITLQTGRTVANSIILAPPRRLRQGGEHDYADRRAGSTLHAMPRAAFGRHRLRRVVDSTLSDVAIDAFTAVGVDDVLGFVTLLVARPATESRFFASHDGRQRCVGYFIRARL